MKWSAYVPTTRVLMEDDGRKNSSTSTACSVTVLPPDHKKQVKNGIKCKLLRILEVILMAVILAFILGFLMVSAFFFTFPLLELTPVVNRFNDCSAALPYSGQVCSRELCTHLTQYPSNSSQKLNISVSRPEEAEQFLVIVLGSQFPSLNPSPECDSAFRSFFCLYILGECQGNTTGHGLVDRTSCIDVRDTKCVKEWNKMEAFLGQGELPICEDLPTTDAVAVTNTEPPSNETSYTSCSEPSTNISSFHAELNCTEQFYFDNVTGTCRPLCGWSPNTKIVLERITNIFTTAVLFLFSAISILSFLTVQRHSMFKYPSFYFIFLVLDSFTISILLMIDIIIGPSQQCLKQDYFDNLLNTENSYATTYSVMNVYLAQEMAYWLLFYALGVFWATAFPFKYKMAKANGRIKPVCILTVIIGILIPLPSFLLILDGYYSTNIYHNGYLTAKNPRLYYLTSILHFSVIVAITTSLLIIIFWIVFKDMVMKRTGSGQKLLIAGTAELKLLLVIVYFTIVNMLSMVIETMFTVVTPRRYLIALLPYFTCESTGQSSNKDCQRFLSIVQQPFLFSLSLVLMVLIGFFPCIVLSFSANFRKCILSIRKYFQRSKTDVLEEQ